VKRYRQAVNATAINDTERSRSASPLILRFLAGVGLLTAVGVFVLVALVVPDGGITATSLRQGVALAAVFAAAPTAALAPRVDAASVVALGGGMTVAGAAVTPGGNILGPVMAAVGLLPLLVGGSDRPSLTAGLIGRLLVYAIVLAAGTWLAMGTTLLTGFAALLAALIASTSTRWRTFGLSH
jgi:hypothetical protein